MAKATTTMRQVLRKAQAPPVGNTAQIRRDGKAGEGEAMIRKA